MSSAGSSRLARLEQRLLSGLPLHKAAHLWTVAEIERFCEDPAARALVPDEDLARLLEELEALCAAEGIEPDELAEPTVETPRIASSAHDRLPMSAECGCSLCSDHRQSDG